MAPNNACRWLGPFFRAWAACHASDRSQVQKGGAINALVLARMAPFTDESLETLRHPGSNRWLEPGAAAWQSLVSYRLAQRVPIAGSLCSLL